MLLQCRKNNSAMVPSQMQPFVLRCAVLVSHKVLMQQDLNKFFYMQGQQFMGLSHKILSYIKWESERGLRWGLFLKCVVDCYCVSQSLQKSATNSQSERLLSDYELLTDPKQMGDRFKFMAVTKCHRHSPTPFQQYICATFSIIIFS